MSTDKKSLDHLNERFSNTPNMPDNQDRMCADLTFNNTKVSGPRVIMNSGYGAQRILANKMDIAPVYTGYEKAYGQYADSKIVATDDLWIVKRIFKFNDLNVPALKLSNYLCVVCSKTTGIYDVIEVKHYESYAETHGHIKPFGPGDDCTKMSFRKGEVIAKAPSIDEYGNYLTGINLMACNVSFTENEEDGFAIAKSVADKITYTQVESRELTVNKNMILLNSYGDNVNYKCFPDIGENINEFICRSRQINKFAASEITSRALRQPTDSDIGIYGKGTIIDIDIIVNDEEELENNACRSQIKKYWENFKRYNTEISQTFGNILHKNAKVTDRFKFIYEQAVNMLNNVGKIEASKNKNICDFATIRFTYAYISHLHEGSKLTDREASKGVTCHILPDEMMPIDKYGRRAQILQTNSAVGRANSFQWYELDLSFILQEFFRKLKNAKAKGKTTRELFDMTVSLYQYIDPEQGKHLMEILGPLPDREIDEFLEDCFNGNYHVRQGPSNTITLEKLVQMYDIFDIKPGRVRIRREIPRHNYKEGSEFGDKERYDKFCQTYLAHKIAKGVNPNNIVYYPDLGMCEDESYKYNDGKIHLKRVTTENEYLEIMKAMKPTDEEIDKDFTDTTYVTDVNDKTITVSVLSEHSVIIAPKFYYILEHIPEGKLSARSIGSVDPFGIPNKTGKSENCFNGPYGTSPIKFGEMELNNALSRIRPEMAYRFLAGVSTNPELRKDIVHELMFGDPTQYKDVNFDFAGKGNFEVVPANQLKSILNTIGIQIFDERQGDIYTPFDDREYSDEELEEICKKQAELHPFADLDK